MPLFMFEGLLNADISSVFDVGATTFSFKSYNFRFYIYFPA